MNTLKRFNNLEETRKTLLGYMNGAENGVVGHFFNYPPTSISKGHLNIKNYEILSSNEDLIGMYIHWPFCNLPNNIEKCDFCCSNTKNDYFSKSLKGEYFISLINEIKLYSEIYKNSTLKWLYIGGGTPLTMSLKMLEKLFGALNDLGLIDETTFITVESRPECISEEKIQFLKKVGVKRISIGVESLSNSVACTMGRINPDENYIEIVRNSVSLIKSYIKYCNIDLIYGHPLESINDVIDSVNYSLDLEPDSISAYPLGLPYNLTNIENSIAKGEYKIKNLHYRGNCFNKIDKLMKESNYKLNYDCIWSKTIIDTYGSESRNSENINTFNQTCIMPYGNWVGIGVGSIGSIGGFGPVINTNNLSEYINMANTSKLPIGNYCNLNINELYRYELVLSILHRRIDEVRFKRKYNKVPQKLFPLEFKALEEYNLVKINDEQILLTEKSTKYLQAIARLFFSKEIEKEYRTLESKRIDYRMYNICYNDLS